MHQTNFKVFDIYKVKDLEIGMRISIHRDHGNLYGTIKSLHESPTLAAMPSTASAAIEIVIKDIATCPEEKIIPNGTTLVSIIYDKDREVMVKVPLKDILMGL